MGDRMNGSRYPFNDAPSPARDTKETEAKKEQGLYPCIGPCGELFTYPNAWCGKATCEPAQ